MLAETFEVDNNNTKRLLEGDRGQRIREKNIIVSAFMFLLHWQNLDLQRLCGIRTNMATEGDRKNLIIMIINFYMSKFESYRILNYQHYICFSILPWLARS